MCQCCPQIAMMRVPTSENQAPEWCGALEWGGVVKAICRCSCGHVSDLAAALQSDEGLCWWIPVETNAPPAAAMLAGGACV